MKQDDDLVPRLGVHSAVQLGAKVDAQLWKRSMEEIVNWSHWLCNHTSFTGAEEVSLVDTVLVWMQGCHNSHNKSLLSCYD